MADSRSIALATLSRCAEALATELAPMEKARLLEIHRQALSVFESVRYRQPTLQRAARIRTLDAQLKQMEPGDRAIAIQARLGLSKSGYYKLKRLADQSTLFRGLEADLIAPTDDTAD